MTGVSCPIFGVQWNPPTLDRDVATRVLAFLEDRRVLYSPYEAESRDHCVQSVLRIREHLTACLADGGIAEDLRDHLRVMRGACRRFLKVAGADDEGKVLHTWRSGEIGLHDFMLNQAIGELRGTCGMQIAQLAVKYGVDVEEELASIIPAPD